MPSQLNYPGVYIEEVPSGVRTIVGVSTSDTAFIDFFPRGPVDQAVRITSFDAFERTFGGLDRRSEASYAIRQYYLNGGSAAWVVRVVGGTADAADITLTRMVTPTKETLTIRAASPGDWGNGLKVIVTVDATKKTFDLTVDEVKKVNGQEVIVAHEVHRNLSMTKTDPRYAKEVVNAASALVKLDDPGLGELPVATTAVGGAPLGVSPGKKGTDGDEPKGTTWLATTGAKALVGEASKKSGIYALDRIAPFIFNLLCIPAAAELGDTAMKEVYSKAQKYCLDRRAFLLIDIPSGVTSSSAMVTHLTKIDRDDHSAIYFPRLEVPDPLNDYRMRNLAPSGTLAGIYARTDATRGIWKSPAGTEATLRGASLARDATDRPIHLTDLENGDLNPIGVNVLRNFPTYGNIAWGARTLNGSDALASEWKYIAVRRTAMYIEESLYQGSKWIVFEPNDEPLWAQIRLNFGAFLHGLFRQGAFQGATPRAAYFVRCDKETTTQNDINQGIVNILVGFAPLKPAEFVVIRIQQMAGQIEA
jgi:phage tail sheath protein FI